MFRSPRSRSLTHLFALLLLAGACSDVSGPGESGPPTVAGAWGGSIERPSYDGGSLRLTVAQAGEALSGEYRMTLTKGTRAEGRVMVRNYGGGLAGGLSGNTVSLAIEVDGSTWYGTAELHGSTMAGAFRLPNGSTAPFTLSR